jgi:lysophospholipase L1-like esterase
MTSGGTAGTATGGGTGQGGTAATGGGVGNGGSPGTGGSSALGGTGGSSFADGGPGDANSRFEAGAERPSLPEAGPEAKVDTISTGGTGGYPPCPSGGTACKILPLGDSITYGVNDEGNAGYRGPLFASAVAGGQKITFTGSLSNGPNTVSGQTFPKNNEGHSGWGISEVTPYSGGNAGIATVIPSPALASGSGGIPNIILLHIGTNDQGSLTATQMTNDLTGLLDKIITNAPDALLVVAQIIPLGYGTNDVIKAYNQAIPGIVQQRAAAGKHVALVDMYTGFNASTMLGSDSIHPNTTGYKFMADQWYSAIGSLLPK